MVLETPTLGTGRGERLYNRRKHPSNAKGHSASLERGYTLDSAPAFGSLAQCNCCRWLALDSVSTGITVL
jgi:hypothetical protein